MSNKVVGFVSKLDQRKMADRIGDADNFRTAKRITEDGVVTMRTQGKLRSRFELEEDERKRVAVPVPMLTEIDLSGATTQTDRLYYHTEEGDELRIWSTEGLRYKVVAPLQRIIFKTSGITPAARFSLWLCNEDEDGVQSAPVIVGDENLVAQEITGSRTHYDATYVAPQDDTLANYHPLGGTGFIIKRIRALTALLDGVQYTFSFAGFDESHNPAPIIGEAVCPTPIEKAFGKRKYSGSGVKTLTTNPVKINLAESGGILTPYRRLTLYGNLYWIALQPDPSNEAHPVLNEQTDTQGVVLPINDLARLDSFGYAIHGYVEYGENVTVWEDHTKQVVKYSQPYNPSLHLYIVGNNGNPQYQSTFCYHVDKSELSEDEEAFGLSRRVVFQSGYPSIFQPVYASGPPTTNIFQNLYSATNVWRPYNTPTGPYKYKTKSFCYWKTEQGQVFQITVKIGVRADATNGSINVTVKGYKDFEDGIGIGDSQWDFVFTGVATSISGYVDSLLCITNAEDASGKVAYMTLRGSHVVDPGTDSPIIDYGILNFSVNGDGEPICTISKRPFGKPYQHDELYSGYPDFSFQVSGDPPTENPLPIPGPVSPGHFSQQDVEVYRHEVTYSYTGSSAEMRVQRGVKLLWDVVWDNASGAHVPVWYEYVLEYRMACSGGGEITTTETTTASYDVTYVQHYDGNGNPDFIYPSPLTMTGKTSFSASTDKVTATYSGTSKMRSGISIGNQFYGKETEGSVSKSVTLLDAGDDYEQSGTSTTTGENWVSSFSGTGGLYVQESFGNYGKLTGPYGTDWYDLPSPRMSAYFLLYSTVQNGAIYNSVLNLLNSTIPPDAYCEVRFIPKSGTRFGEGIQEAYRHYIAIGADGFPLFYQGRKISELTPPLGKWFIEDFINDKSYILDSGELEGYYI